MRFVPSYVVAAEVDSATDLRAHVLLNLGDLTHLYGVALCGFLAEYLTGVPDLDWEQVNLGSRCEHCQELWTTGAQAPK